MIKIHALIIGRLKSKRLTKKVLRVFGKYNLSSFLIWRLKNFNFRNCIFELSYGTSYLRSDDEIEEKLKNLICVYRGHPDNVIDRILSADKFRNLESDYFVRITADNPFTCPIHLQKMINAINQNNFPEYISIPDLNTGLRCELIKASYLNRVHVKVKNPENSEYMTFMLNRPDKGKMLYLDPEVPLEQRNLSFTVDELAQYEFAKQIVNNGFTPDKSYIQLLEITNKLKNKIFDEARADNIIPKSKLVKYKCNWID